MSELTALLGILAGDGSRAGPADAQKLLTAATAMDGVGDVAATAVAEVVLRLIEMRVLADHELQQIAKLWDVHVGRERDMIRARLETLLGEVPPDSFVEHVRDCLETAARRSRRSGETTDADFLRAVSRYAAGQTDVELRCECCGYHFRRSDLGSARLEIADELRMTLAASVHPFRTRDPLKPVNVTNARGQTHSLTGLDLDHDVPESGLGNKSEKNLRLLCRFCNHGKMIYRFPLEPLSPLVAGSLGQLAHEPNWNIVNQVIAVAALRHGGSRCRLSGDGPQRAELTVRWRDATRWFVPWNLEVVSYEALPPAS